MTRPERMRPSTSIARPSLVHSSVTVRHLSCCPLAHQSKTKSYDHTWFAPVGAGGRGRPVAICLRGRRRATFSSVQDRRCDRPRRCAYATCSRRAGMPTVFCCDILHRLDLEVAFRHQILQLPVLLFELLQPTNVVRLERPEPLPPRVDRLLAHTMALGHCRHRVAIDLTQDPPRSALP